MTKSDKIGYSLVSFTFTYLLYMLWATHTPPSVGSPQFEDRVRQQLQKSDLRGIDLDYVLSLAILETGYGTGTTYLNTHNMFSITMGNHRAGEAFFASHHWNKVYQNDQESIDDFINLITLSAKYRKAYRFALMDEHEKFFQALKSAGYAEDKDYAEKLNNIFKRLKTVEANERISKYKSLAFTDSDYSFSQGIYK